MTLRKTLTGSQLNSLKLHDFFLSVSMEHRKGRIGRDFLIGVHNN